MATPADGPPSNFRFADLTLDAARRHVARDGQPIELKALDYDLLRFLVESAPNVVNADVVAEKVWGRHFVSPENVAQRVMLLRQSLSDDANRPRYIETVRNKGYRLIPVVERLPAAAIPAAPQRRRWPVPATIAALLAIALVALAAYRFAGQAAPPLRRSVAVLPFENMSPAPDDAHFALGMQDEIVSQLTKLSGLKVIPVQPGGDPQGSIATIARDLQVATALGGSVYYSEGRVRVIPRLTEALTGVSLWSDSYERELSDIFAIQSEIALEVARELSVELSPDERRRVERAPTPNPQARHLYLMARGRDTRSPSQLLLALDEIEQAVALDPGFKEAWGIDSVLRSGYAQFLDPESAAEHRLRGEQAARRAMEIDPLYGEAYAALGTALISRADWAGAEQAFRKARSLNVPLAGLGSYAFLLLGVGKAGPLTRDIFEEMRAAEPQNQLFYRFLAFVHEALGETAQANDFYESAKRVFPGDSREALLMTEQRMHWLVGRKELAAARSLTVADPLNAAMLASLDTPERALGDLRSAFAASRAGDPNARRTIGLWAGHFGDPALALEALRAAIDEQGAQATYLWLPQLAPMRRLPEFAAYLRDLGMVAYWQEYGWPTFCRPLGALELECR